MKKIVIIGGGFAGLNAAKGLRGRKDIRVTLVDKRNHHLFQPLLYQVAMAGLSPADIAVPIRNILSGDKTQVILGEVQRIDPEANKVYTKEQEIEFDTLILSCGSETNYFGHCEWEQFAPGLKSLDEATEVRRRVLLAFEKAECTKDEEERKRLMTFVIIGGGPTGVELAGAIGEMSRYTLVKDFNHIDSKMTRIILVDAGTRILSTFSEKLSFQTVKDLEKFGVDIWTNTKVTNIDKEGVQLGKERIQSATVLWAAGVKANKLSDSLPFKKDGSGRIHVLPDLSVEGHPNIFVLGDLAHFPTESGKPLPGLAPVAMQQGRFIAENIIRELEGKNRLEFKYKDKGTMATIGRSRGIVEYKKLKLTGWLAWVFWLVVHIYYLTGFRNRLFVVGEWALAYLTFKKGARLILDENRDFSQK